MTLAPWPYPFWIAHRGAGALAPENTLAAFRVGAAHGYRAFECDVKLSADGVPFLLHDETLQRTTDGQGPAHERTWAELSRLDAGSWHGRMHTGEPVPSFSAIAAYCLRNGHALNIELKPAGNLAFETGRLVAAEAAVRWAGQAVLPLLSSFKPKALEGARAGASHLPRALLLEDWPEGWLEASLALGCMAVVCAHEMLDAASVARLHDAGLRVLAYTVNDLAPAQRLAALGIDGLITDRIDRHSPASPPTD